VQDGGALYFTSVSNPNLAWERKLSNVVIWGNLANGSTTSVSASLYLDDDGAGHTQPPTISHSLIANSGGSGAGWATEMGIDGGDNLDADPLFVQPVNPALAPTQSGNVRLRSGSPAIDVGDGESVLNFPLDLDLRPRVVNGTVDLGAYESTSHIFSDGFELGSTARWSLTVPTP
jgi:hypothetical protein